MAMMPFLWLVFVVGSVTAYRYFYLIGALVFFVAFMGLRNAFLRSFAKAGPRTSRQVPPSPIALCQQLSAQELSECYRRGELSCLEVVSTYIAHIRRVNPYLNAMVFHRFDEALAEAEVADAIWADWRRSNGAKPEPSWLTGVPCTIKECMEVVGCPNTSGQPYRTHFLSDRESPVVRNFREAGAIILGVTNTSELCMWYESSNYNYGITCNPFDTRAIVGGSSGGEGVAAGAAFSAFSLGSDIGGSIRMPAFFNGVFGHKTTPHYINNQGQHPGAKTSANHYMTTGPITRFPDDIVPLCRVAARGGFGRDPAQYPPSCPFAASYTDAGAFFRGHAANNKKPLRVFAIEDFGLMWPIRVSGTEIAAVHKAAEALRDLYGAKVTYVNLLHPKRSTGGVVPEEFKGFSQVLSMWSDALTTDPTETKFHVLMSEGHPHLVNWGAEACRWFVGRSRHTLPAIALSIIEQMETLLPKWLIFSRGGLVLPFKQQLEELLGNDGIIIAPTFPTAAPRHHYPLWNPLQFQYTAAFNVLQLPAAAVPVWPEEEMDGRARAYSVFEVDRFNKEGTTEADADRPASAMRPVTDRKRRLSDDFHLPKGVQIVGATNQDALCVSTASALAQALGGYRYPGWARLEGIDY